MAYLLLIIETRGQRATRPPAEARGVYEKMLDFAADLQQSGVLLRAESLRGDEHALRIGATAPGKAPPILDGPFAEAKEMIGGFFLIDVATRDAALAIARRCPALDWACIEVRECAPCYLA